MGKKIHKLRMTFLHILYLFGYRLEILVDPTPIAQKRQVNVDPIKNIDKVPIKKSKSEVGSVVLVFVEVCFLYT